MYALELTPEFLSQGNTLHPKRYKQVYLHIFALQRNPRPPTAEMLDAKTYRLRAGPYRVTYEIDDTRRRVRVFLLEEMTESS